MQVLIDENSDTVVGIPLDVTDQGQIDSAVAAAPDLLMLINNAGVEDITTDAFADDFVQRVKANSKTVEAEAAAVAHQPSA